jgi:hypothetical protein
MVGGEGAKRNVRAIERYISVVLDSLALLLLFGKQIHKTTKFAFSPHF